MDIDKHQYPDGYACFRDRIRPGGLAVVDNLVWSGKVAAGAQDPDTQGAREYIRLMWSDTNFLSSLMPVRDGVGVSLRLG
jgi:predicted O-methyltransferase YrrM